jgi:hypothetical protein
MMGLWQNLRWAQYSAKEDVLRMQMEWKTQLSTLGKFTQEVVTWESNLCMLILMMFLVIMLFCMPFFMCWTHYQVLIFFVGNELQEMARAASGYHKVLAENRALYNEVQDLKGVSGFC